MMEKEGSSWKLEPNAVGSSEIASHPQGAELGPDLGASEPWATGQTLPATKFSKVLLDHNHTCTCPWSVLFLLPHKFEKLQLIPHDLQSLKYGLSGPLQLPSAGLG